MASLRYVLLLQRDVPKAAAFYSQGLGLTVKTLTERWAELSSGNATIALKAADGEAYVTTGYSPILSFNVPDLQGAVTRLLQLGAVLDGPIQYPVEGKVAALRAPCGQMLSLYEPSDYVLAEEMQAAAAAQQAAAAAGAAAAAAQQAQPAAAAQVAHTAATDQAAMHTPAP